MNDDNFLDAMEALGEGYPRDIEPVKVVPDPSYVKGHSDGVAEDREAILAVVQQAVEYNKYEGEAVGTYREECIKVIRESPIGRLPIADSIIAKIEAIQFTY